MGLWTLDFGLWTNPDFENMPTVAASIAVGTANEDVAQKLHLNLFKPGAAASLALALRRIEAKGALVESALPGRLRLSKKRTNVIESPDVNRRIRSRGFAEERLIDKNNLSDSFPALQQQGLARES